jgi:hypothetical protein
MFSFTPRAGRRPLARTIAVLTVLTATAVLGACSDETTAPTPALSAPPRAGQTDAAAPSPEQLETKVDLAILDKRVTFNTLTGYALVRVAFSCSTYDIFDVVVEMQQDQKNGGQSSTVSGTNTIDAIDCTTGTTAITVAILPESDFVSGTATVTARIANYQPWVIPTEVRRRVRVTT